jgi:hypothetical protein
MRNVIGVAVIVVLGVVGYFMSRSSDKAIEYNDRIIALQTKIVQGMIDFSKSFENADGAQMEKKHAELVATIEGVTKEAMTIGSFEDSTEFRDAAIEMFGFYDSIAKKEYLEIVNILNKETPGEEDLARINEIVNSISSREEALDKKFQGIQQAFASKHNIKLVDNKLQRQIDNL